MKFNHKGIKIGVNSEGRFLANVGEILIETDSLAATKEKIDKELTASATSRTLNLPVVFLIQKEGRNGGETQEVRAGVLTGINRTTREAMIQGIKKDLDVRLVLADTIDNRELLRSFLMTRNKADKYKAEIDAADLTTGLGYGRISAERYDEILTGIETKHARLTK